MLAMDEISEMLNAICYAPVPYETRVEMCEAVVNAVKEGEFEDVDNGRYKGTIKKP